MSERVLLKIEDNVAVITLNRPKKGNAFDMDMFLSLRKQIDIVGRNRSVRALIIRGAGGQFSTGLDIKSVMTSPKDVVKLIWKWWPTQANLAQKLSVGLRKLPIPVIAVIEGRCWGAGMQVVLGADFRYSTSDASLSIMESRWGLIPDMGGSLGLREIMPLDKALELTMTSQEVSGQEALDCNLVTKVCEDPMAEALEFCSQLEETSPDALSGIKKVYHKAWHSNDSQMLMAEWVGQWRVLFGRNRVQAIKRQKGDKKAKYLPRSPWA